MKEAVARKGPWRTQGTVVFDRGAVIEKEDSIARYKAVHTSEKRPRETLMRRSSLFLHDPLERLKVIQPPSSTFIALILPPRANLDAPLYSLGLLSEGSKDISHGRS